MIREDGFTLHTDVDMNGIATHNRTSAFKTATADFFRRVNSSLAGKPVPMRWVEHGYMPSGMAGQIAFTDGESVFINSDFFRDSLQQLVTGKNMLAATEPIARLKGASYHELAHVMYTPRMGAEPVKSCLAISSSGSGHNIMRSFNMLEDQRIEMRFAGKYRSAVDYFIPMSVKHIIGEMDKPVGQVLAFPLLYGRKFIPKEIVDLSENLHNEWIKARGLSVSPARLKEIIDEYLTLIFPSQHARGLELIKLFDSYMFHLHQQDWSNGSGQGDNHDQQRRGTPSRSSDQRDDVESTKEWMEELESEHSDDGDFGDGGEDSDGDSDSTGSGSSSGESEEDDNSADNTDADGGSGSDEFDGDAPPDDNGQGSDSHGNGVGAGDSAGDGVAHTELGEMIQKLQELGFEAEERCFDSAFGDLKNIRKAITTARRDWTPDLRRSLEASVTPAMRKASNAIQDVFTVIRAEGEDIWATQRQAGRLNVRDAINARGTHFDVFDEWIDVGDEATSFEVVILVDQSSSMQGAQMMSVSAGLWVIRHACIQMGIPVTAIGYNDNARMLYTPSCRVSPVVYRELNSVGGTDPTEAIEWATSIFQASQASHKLLFSLTDGEWNHNLTSKNLMNVLSGMGVHSTLIIQGLVHYDYRTDTKLGVSYPTTPADNYGHGHLAKCADGQRDLPKIVSTAMEKLAVGIMRSNL